MLPCNKCGTFYTVRARSYHHGLCSKCAEAEEAKRAKHLTQVKGLGVQGVQGCTALVRLTSDKR